MKLINWRDLPAIVAYPIRNEFAAGGFCAVINLLILELFKSSFHSLVFSTYFIFKFAISLIYIFNRAAIYQQAASIR